jgi:hypothetical protein
MKPAEDFFDVPYRNIPGKGVFATGGLKFHNDEDELRQKYARALQSVRLEALLGEAALWVLWPSTAAIWVFPFLVWRLRIDWAILADIGVFWAIQIVTMLFYSRSLNYGVFILGNRALQALAYAAFAAGFWLAGTPLKVVSLAVWLILMAFGIVQVIFVIPFVPLLRRLFDRTPADQALRFIAHQYEPGKPSAAGSRPLHR